MFTTAPYHDPLHPELNSERSILSEKISPEVIDLRAIQTRRSNTYLSDVCKLSCEAFQGFICRRKCCLRTIYALRSRVALTCPLEDTIFSQ